MVLARLYRGTVEPARAAVAELCPNGPGGLPDDLTARDEVVNGRG